MASGIYLITCTKNRRRYVGSARNIEVRWSKHRSDLTRGKHHSIHLQRCWTKYGPEAFEWAVLEEVNDADQILAREQFWIDTLHPELNISPFANRPTNKGHKMPAEFSRRLSERNRQRWAELSSEERSRIQSERTKKAYANGSLKKRYGPRPESTKAKIKIARARQTERQRAQTAKKREAWEAGRADREQERRRKLSERLTGRKISDATKAKLRAAAAEQMADPAMQEQHRAAVKAAMQRPEVREKHRKGIANRPPPSAEHREHIGAAHRGKKRPPETGQKIAAAKRGKKHSPETIEKLKAAQQARWARVRAEKEKGD
jgi:group I intron endonuclease